MTKLYAKRERERAAARQAAGNLRAHARAIAQTFPPGVHQFARGRFIVCALIAIQQYADLMPQGVSPELHPDERVRRKYRRRHRTTAEQPYPASAHRPADPHRHALISDLYDAWMSARGSDDPDEVRGFRPTADAVLTAAGLAPVSEHEQTYIREQIKACAAFVRTEEQNKPG